MDVAILSRTGRRVLIASKADMAAHPKQFIKKRDGGLTMHIAAEKLACSWFHWPAALRTQPRIADDRADHLSIAIPDTRMGMSAELRN
jgi:hypothetical protein